MVYVNKEGYLERKTHVCRRNPHGKGAKRDWWIVKYGAGKSARVRIGKYIGISFPKKLLGKRVKFKIEVIKWEN